jgi:hypothetical protein
MIFLIRLQTDTQQSLVRDWNSTASLEEVNQQSLLLGETVEDIFWMVGDWSLEEETQVTQNWSSALSVNFDSSEEFTQKQKIEHDWGGEEGVLTGSVGDQSHGSVEEDLGDVLIHSLLCVSGEWSVLDNDGVIDSLVVIWVQNLVGFDFVTKNTSLGNFLRSELSWFVQVLTVIVTKMVVTHAGSESETRSHEEVKHDRLELGLSGLEIGTTDEGVVVGVQFDHTFGDGVLWGTVQESDTFKGTGNGVKHRTGDWGVVSDQSFNLGGGLQVLFVELLGVSSPENDNLIDGLLEVLDVLSELVNAFLVGTFEDVVDSITLVRSDVVWIEDSWKWNMGFQIVLQLFDQSWLQNLSSVASIVQVQTGNIPTSDGQVIGGNKWDQILDGSENVSDDLSSSDWGLWLFVVTSVVDVVVLEVFSWQIVDFDTNLSDDRLGHGTVPIGALGSLSGLPGELLLVSEDTGSEGGTVVSSPSDKHDTHLLWGSLVNSDGVRDLEWLDVASFLVNNVDSFVECVGSLAHCVVFVCSV